jgi:hypothetical protein
MEELVSKIVSKYWKEISKKPNVIGFSGSLMPKIKGGSPTSTRAFRIYVSKKVPREELRASDLVPSEVMVELSETLIIPTDVVQIGEIRALGSPSEAQKRHRPPIAGVSAMGYWEGSTACTLSGMAKDKKTGRLGFFCNNHCGAWENKAPVGTPYLQPSPYDGGKFPDDKIGELYRFVPISFEEYTCPYRQFLTRTLLRIRPSANKVDSAFIVSTIQEYPWRFEVLNIGPVSGKRDPSLAEKVQKMGRTTGHTVQGTVVDLDWNGRVGYSRGTAFFTDCILIEGSGFSAGGDSSSPILSMDSPPSLVGQLFAGSESHTVACKIKNIEELLDIEILC